MATEKSIAEALDLSLSTAENVFLSAFYNKVREMIDNPKTEVDKETGEVTYTYSTIDIDDLRPLVDFVKECYKNVSV